MSNSFDIIVIGGGLVGGAIAWGAAQAGASTARLDEGDVAFRAAHGNFGLVWVQRRGAGMPPYAHWTRRSADVWLALADALIGSTGTDVARRQPGGLFFASANRNSPSGRRWWPACTTKVAMPAPECCTATRCARWFPDSVNRWSAAPSVRAMVMPARCNCCVLSIPVWSAISKHISRPAGSTRSNPPRARSACGAARSSLPPKSWWIAAGLGRRSLAPMVGLDMPVKPLRGQILVTERLRPLLAHPTHVMRQTQEGSMMLGDSQEDVGLDTATTSRVIGEIAARNVRVLPARADANVVRIWAALRVMSPDGLPIYDQSAHYPGAFATTCHGGVTLAGAHAMALTPAIRGGTVPDSLAAFSARRFAAPETAT
jgi:hydrogen cyanide synthase HcnC